MKVKTAVNAFFLYAKKAEKNSTINDMFIDWVNKSNLSLMDANKIYSGIYETINKTAVSMTAEELKEFTNADNEEQTEELNLTHSLNM